MNGIQNNLNANEFSINKKNSNIELIGNNHFTNEIRTTKYRLWNFFPLSIYYQFHRFPNIYFLTLTIISYIPNVSPINNLTTLVPFVTIFFLSLIKEYVEDIYRFKNNLEINNHEVKIYKENKFIKSQYKLIKHGDIVELNENEFAPADMIILCNEKNTKETYIETSSLDGEKSLKPKYFIEDISNNFYENNFSFDNFNFEFKSSKPNFKINNMNGYIIFKNKKYIITDKNFIPRGAKIKDLNKIYSLVIWTGHDTKIMLNTVSKDNKLSSLERKMNIFIIIIFATQLILMTIALILNYIFNTIYNRFIFQGYTDENKISLAFLNFLTYLILLNTLIPISLIITIEIARICQGIFIYWDHEMIDNERKIRQKIITVNINEELGQINFLLSDKTGTLTMNKMDFRFLNIGFNLYEFFNVWDLNTNKFDDILNLKIFNNMIFEKSKISLQTKKEKNISKRLSNYFNKESNYPYEFYSNDKDENLKILNEEEFFKLSIILLLSCHDCFIKKENNNIIYNGESPDEISFLEKLKDLNIKLLDVNLKNIKISIFEEEINLTKLATIEFDNDRKCMSVILNCKFKNKNYNFLFIKGADNALLNRSNENNTFVDIIKKSIDFFSNKGLRTLIYGFKIWSKKELNLFLKDFENYNLTKKIKDISNWEYNINLIGSTAVEDKLIPNLDRTIKYIKNSQIKLWVLTGDKLETAKQIGFSCSLLDSLENLFSIKNEIDFEKFINIKIDKYFEKNNKNYSLILEGIFLEKIFDKKLKDKFYDIVKNFKSCIFCRVTPLQKASIVELVKSKNNITWAIGDGANDVSMIQKAHIGIGIFGNEGRQAVNNSDFAIPDFTKLDRLLFYHGRLNYLRISKTILYFFYKNIIFTLPNFWFSFQSGFNGLNFFPDFFISLYNTIITAFPLGIRSLMELNVSDYKIEYKNNRNKLVNYFDLTNKNKFIIINPKIRKLYPFLYNIGRNKKIFTNSKFFFMFLLSSIESLFFYFISIYSFYNFQYNNILCSMTLVSLIVFNVNIKLTFETNFLWFGHILVTFILSIGIYLLLFLFNDINTFLYFYLSFFLNNLTFYLVFILGLLFLAVTNFTFLVLNNYIFPSEVLIIDKYVKKKLHNKKGLKKIIDENENKNRFYKRFVNRY